jgi:hypothetical protein
MCMFTPSRLRLQGVLNNADLRFNVSDDLVDPHHIPRQKCSKDAIPPLNSLFILRSSLLSRIDRLPLLRNGGLRRRAGMKR